MGQSTSLQKVGLVILHTMRPENNNNDAQQQKISYKEFEAKIDKILEEEKDEVKDLIANQHKDPSKLLIGAESDPTSRKTALGWALSFSLPQLAEKFLKLGMRPNVYDATADEWETDFDVLIHLLLFGSKYPCPSIEGLHLCGGEETLQCVKLLLQYFPKDIEALCNDTSATTTTKRKRAPPLVALAGANEKLANVPLAAIDELFIDLIMDGADPLTWPPGPHGSTLHTAVETGETRWRIVAEIVSTALQRPAVFSQNVNYFYSNQTRILPTPLTLAAFKGSVKSFNLILGSPGVDILAGPDDHPDVLLTLVAKYRPLADFYNKADWKYDGVSELTPEAKFQQDWNQMLVNLVNKLVQNKMHQQQYKPPAKLEFHSDVTGETVLAADLANVNNSIPRIIELFLHDSKMQQKFFGFNKLQFFGSFPELKKQEVLAIFKDSGFII